MIKFSAKKSVQFFEVAATTDLSQVAMMTLKVGQVSGEYGNEHKRSDQILYVIDGSGEAIIEGETVSIQTGDVIVIEAGANHQVKNTGKGPLKTLNFYSPPAY